MPGPLPRAERSVAQTYHAVLLVPRGVGQGARGRGRPAVLFVCAGPIGCKEKGPRWAVRGGRTTRAGCGRFCTWARRGPPRTALALSLEAPCPRPATPRQRGLRPLSWYSSLVVQAPLRPPPPACHLSCPEKALGRGPCGNRGSPLSCCRQQPEAHNGPHWSRAHPGPDVATAPKAWVHNPGFSGLPCEWPWVPAWNQTAWAGQLGRPGCWLCPAPTLRGCWVGQAPSASAWELLSAKAACHAASKGR